MTWSANAPGSAEIRLGRVTLIAAAAGLLVAATAAAPVRAAGAPPTSEADAIRVTLSNILALHHAVGEFVGARLALRDADGTITEVSAGTPTLDPASGPVDPDVPWNIGSATKAFVAVVVLQLAEEGRIDLDAGIDAYLPDLAGAEQITPRMLLNHTSGLNEYLDEALVTDPLRRWTPAELIAVAEAAGRVGEPGGPHHYANTNYIILAEIIEAVTGNPWADEVHTRIAEPLGLTHTGVIGDTEPAPGFELIDGSLVDATSSYDPSVGGAAGAMQSTSRDLLVFATALADGALLSPESQAAVKTFLPAEDLSQFGIDHGYGLGLERYTMDDMTVLGHLGTGQTGSSYLGYDPERGTAIAVTTNTAIAGPSAIMAIEALTAINENG
jgi:D-alanyl-D-alanine carboxypeptidase